MAPDFLAVGHVTRDIVPGGYTAGGAVTYSAVTALRMGLASAVVTSAAPDVDLRSEMPGIDVRVSVSAETTTFENLYAADAADSASPPPPAPWAAATSRLSGAPLPWCFWGRWWARSIPRSPGASPTA